MLLWIFNIFLYIINGFSINSIPINLNNHNCINNRYCIKMYYSPIQDAYYNHLNIISTFRANILINKWIDHLYSYDNEFTPKYIYKFIYDMKTFNAINSGQKNIIYLTWIPEPEFLEKNIAYLISCKIYNNEIQIHRIAQSPYYDDILDVKSYDLVKDIEEIFYNNSLAQYNISYSHLHKYDNRYLLSWNFYKNIT
jgi:hypothetical protein